MRRLGRRLAGACGREAEFAGELCIRVEIALRQVGADRIDARVDEFGDVAVAGEGLVRLHRTGDRNSDRAGKAQRAAGGGNAQPDAIGIEPPQQPNGRNCDQRGKDHAAQQIGIDRQEECDGVGVEDHHVDEIDRHHQLVVLELRQQNERDDHRQRHQRRGRRPPQQRQPEKIQQKPGGHKGGLALEIGLGRQHDGERDRVQNGDDDECRKVAARLPRLAGKTRQ